MHSKPRHIFIIAEAGVNHNGSAATAKKMIDAAKECGADAVKFQTFTAEQLTSRCAPKASYQRQTTNHEESQYEMLKKLELDHAAHRELFSHCAKKKIVFLSSPFDPESIDLLDKMRLGIFKIPSGEITNLPFLRKIGRLRKRVILSTGMSDLNEIKQALDVLIASGTLKKNITVLHCTTEYPARYRDVNLLAMLTIRDTFKIDVGYSDHSPGIDVPIAAAALGASVIEKHFTLDKNMPGPDHKASLDPQELAAMIRAVRNIEQCLGDGIKKASAPEQRNKACVRKSIVALTDIEKGEIFSESNIAVKRPGTGISPMKWDSVIGSKAVRNFKEDELIRL
ncbi:MAG: N-acetylneuraminate synthase [Candidatus Omnitrophica bacterium]|nr:N-acetylneuraminate synthase [Candidatus Omnitrophota bacterium]